MSNAVVYPEEKKFLFFIPNPIYSMLKYPKGTIQFNTEEQSFFVLNEK